MLVYSKGELIRHQPIILSPTETVYKLTHPDSGMNIEVVFDDSNAVNNRPYKVFKEDSSGNFSLYKEFYKGQKSLKENFEEAILYFEDCIYKSLNETPPSQDSKRPDDLPPTETFQEVPIVGDIVQIGNAFGKVTDVIGTKVITKEMTKEEAMAILRSQKNAQISLAGADNPDVDSFKGGGITSRKAIPIVGDVIQVGNEYGLVTDVIKNKVETKKITKADALRILKNKLN